TAPSIDLNTRGSLQVSGWIRASQTLDISITETSGNYSFVTDAGSEIAQTGTTGTLSVTGDKGFRVAGTVRAAATAAVPILAACTVFEILPNADIAVTGAGSTLNLTAGTDLALALGSNVRAGVSVTSSGGPPQYTVTGSNSDIVINAPKELRLGGLVVASGGLAVSAGTSSRSHSAEFAAIFATNPTHYMASHDRYSILLTGTIAVLGAAEELVLSASDDVVL
ncbi:MAG: hypothetical protein ACK6EB_19230, partial [Planctomyces sp.]